MEGNNATGISLQGTLTYSGETRNLFNTNQIVISSSGIDKIGLSDLNPEAVTLLKNFLTASIYQYYGFPFGGFNLTDNFFTVTVSGTLTPAATNQVNVSLD